MAPRLILVAGPGGAGSSTCAARLAQRWELEQRGRVAVLDLDPVCGARALMGAALRASGAGGRERDHRGDGGGGVLTSWVDRAGLDARVPEELGRLPGADVLLLVDEMSRLREVEDLRAVVVDVGARLPELVSVADRAPWLVGQLTLLQRGWLSSVRPLVSMVVPDWGADSVATVAAAAGDRVGSWPAMVADAEVMLVGSAPTERRAVAGDDRVRRLHIACELYGLSVSGADDVSTLEGSEPPARAAADPAGRGAGVWEGAGSHWVWRLPLPSVRSGELALARDVDELAVEALGVRRVVRIPTAMRRLRIGGARLRGGMLSVSFEERRAEQEQ